MDLLHHFTISLVHFLCPESNLVEVVYRVRLDSSLPSTTDWLFQSDRLSCFLELPFLSVSLKMKVKLHFEILYLGEVEEFHWVKPDESLFRALLVACKQKKVAAEGTAQGNSTFNKW